MFPFLGKPFFEPTSVGSDTSKLADLTERWIKDNDQADGGFSRFSKNLSMNSWVSLRLLRSCSSSSFQNLIFLRNFRISWCSWIAFLLQSQGFVRSLRLFLYRSFNCCFRDCNLDSHSSNSILSISQLANSLSLIFLSNSCFSSSGVILYDKNLAIYLWV